MGKFSSRITAVRSSVTVVFLEQLVLSSLTLNQSFNEVQSRFFFISPLFCPYRSEIVPCRFMTQFFIAVPFSPLNVKITRSRRAPGEIYQRANVFAKKKKKRQWCHFKGCSPFSCFWNWSTHPSSSEWEIQKTGLYAIQFERALASELQIHCLGNCYNRRYKISWQFCFLITWNASECLIKFLS